MVGGGGKERWWWWETMVGGGKGRMLCLFVNRCATNKQRMPNNVVTKQLDSVPLHSVPANSVEHSSLNSGMQKIAGHPAKFHSTGFCQNDQIPAGIRGALIRPPYCHSTFLILIISFILVQSSRLSPLFTETRDDKGKHGQVMTWAMSNSTRQVL